MTVLAKPSDHIEAYFENTEGLVDGVETAYYSGKIAVREIHKSAKREHADDTTAYQCRLIGPGWGAFEIDKQCSQLLGFRIQVPSPQTG